MKVFKFGGASVKTAEALRNVGAILQRFNGDRILTVVSAMGKTTDALERLTMAYYRKEPSVQPILDELREYHFRIVRSLFPASSHPVYDEINNTFVEIEWVIEEEPRSFGFVYDQIVSVGELLSSRILSAYLKEAGIANTWLDARSCIQTDNTYREGKVNWELSRRYALEIIPPLLENNPVVITQGFLGGTSENFTTTLGREGSDYSAAIFAYALDASEVTIWKDVPGVLNADPKWFDDTRKLDRLSYQEAIELTYYGATVIHPKTIKPLQNKNIPLRVKSFLSPGEEGTLISSEPQAGPLIPSFIFKMNQVLISISTIDFSFIIEENLRDIFDIFSRHAVKINLMQNTALSFSVSVDNDTFKIPGLINDLQKNYKVRYNENLELVTIRNYNQATIDRVTADKYIFVEQRSRHTVQVVMKDKSQITS